MISRFSELVICVFLILFITSSSYQPQQLALTSKVIATIGKHQILVSDFKTRYEDYLFSTGIKDNLITRQAILENMISEIILMHYDNNKRIFDDPEFIKEKNWVYKQAVLSFLQDQEIYAKIKVTDEEIREAYFKSNQKIAARHLFANSEEEANNLYQLLQTGATFNELAKQVFTDSTLQNNGGYLGYFSWGDMDPAFEDAAYTLKIGEISKPIKTKNGYSIIRLDDRISHPLLTEDEFSRKRSHMERVVRIRKKKFAEDEFINKVFSEDKLKMDEKLLSYILKNLSYSYQNSVEDTKKDYSKVCLRYGQKSYSIGQLENRIREIPNFHLQKINSLENLKAVAKGIVLQDILFNIATQKGFNKELEVKTITSKAQKNIFLKYKRKEINDNYFVPDSAVEKFYNDNSHLFIAPEEINIQEIIVNKKSLADTLLLMINDKIDFGSLAERYSMRNWSAKNKGILGLAPLSKFGMLKDTLWNAELGKVIGPIQIENLFGYFKVLEKKSSSLRPFSEVKNQAIMFAKKEQSRNIIEKYITKIEERIPVSINNQILASVVIDN